MKIKLTKELLQKEYRSSLKIVLFSVFVVAGLACFLSPIIYCDNIKSLMANMAFMLIIAVPFCGIGLKNIVGIVKKNNNIKNGRYLIVEDVVTQKQMLHNGTSKNTSDSYCQLNFEKYTKKTGKAVVVKRSVYDESKKGDIFYLVYVQDKLLGFYPATKYELM